MKPREVHIEMLSGPTHLHGGLSFGNIASSANRLKISSPKRAALQSLEKMKLLHDLGARALIFPPQPRPDFDFLLSLGFSGSKTEIIKHAYETAPQALFQATSSAMMWMANAASSTPSQDSSDKKVHISIANLAADAHRSIEAAFSYKMFKKVFHNTKYFTIHPPLPACYELFDEGAANHTRFCMKDSSCGLHLFVWGRSMRASCMPKQYPARQTLEAEEAIVRRHLLDPDRVIFCQQNPSVIDKGVFHNDVIATGHNDLFFVHEDAFVDTPKILRVLEKKLPIRACVIARKMLSVEEAVRTYLFNSQIISVNDQTFLIASKEVKKSHGCQKALERLKSFGVNEVLYVDLDESMKNGGGAACLRLRLIVSDAEWQKILPTVIFTSDLYEELKECVEQYYPEKLCLKDLLDPKVQKQLEKAYKRVYQILKITYF